MPTSSTWTPARARRRPLSSSSVEAIWAYVFLMPNLLLILAFTAFPVVAGFGLSFARWDLLQGLDHSVPNNPAAPVPAERLKRHYELARTLIASRQSLAALDVASESQKLREAYGPHRFGQCCLIARRLPSS